MLQTDNHFSNLIVPKALPLSMLLKFELLKTNNPLTSQGATWHLTSIQVCTPHRPIFTARSSQTDDGLGYLHFNLYGQYEQVCASLLMETVPHWLWGWLKVSISLFDPIKNHPTSPNTFAHPSLNFDLKTHTWFVSSAPFVGWCLTRSSVRMPAPSLTHKSDTYLPLVGRQ